MTIKKRMLFSYLSAIIITLASVFLIVSMFLTVTIGKVPNLSELYKMLSTQRSLTKEEEWAYLTLDTFFMNQPATNSVEASEELLSIIKSIEEMNLSIALRQNEQFTYFSDNLVETSLYVHAPDYELNNFKPIGTLDNAGNFYHYVKKDFFNHETGKESFIVLKRESTLLEFFTKWGLWVVILIIFIAISAALFITKRLHNTTIKPIEDLRKTTQSIHTTQDLSLGIQQFPQKNITQEIADLQISFKEMWLELEEANQLKEIYEENRKDLIANISHDLKTPITSIIGYVEGLRDGVANTEEKRRAYLEIVHQKAVSLNELIEELFLYSKLELNEYSLDFKTKPLRPLIDKILLSYQTSQPDVLWEFNNKAEETGLLMDAIQIERVLINIIENSLKFQDDKKNRTNISLSLLSKEDSLILKIKDNGIGINETDLEHVFERFYRGDKSRTTLVKGSGLGLSIVNQLMIAHQGKVFINSQKHVGTEVTLVFPLLKETI